MDRFQSILFTLRTDIILEGVISAQKATHLHLTKCADSIDFDRDACGSSHDKTRMKKDQQLLDQLLLEPSHESSRVSVPIL
mmetsp:Transcript_16369/g.31007  ORF Transcript_16369/g.31007 Transcript_16369/m.31007 type:complete len:81 (-) Transcript_16369:1148-1390(-)